MGCCLSCEKFKFGHHRTSKENMMGGNNYEAHPSVKVCENGVKIVTLPAAGTINHLIQDPSQDPSSSIHEQYISPSTHALSAAMAQPLPPISETKEVTELHTGSNLGAESLTGYPHEIDGFQQESYYSVNSFASPAHMPESGFFRLTPSRDLRWWGRRGEHNNSTGLGEYCLTPLHEGGSASNYYNHSRMDTNQFASLFSDENPNACSIV